MVRLNDEVETIWINPWIVDKLAYIVAYSYRWWFELFYLPVKTRVFVDIRPIQHHHTNVLLDTLTYCIVDFKLKNKKLYAVKKHTYYISISQ